MSLPPSRSLSLSLSLSLYLLCRLFFFAVSSLLHVARARQACRPDSEAKSEQSYIISIEIFVMIMLPCAVPHKLLPPEKSLGLHIRQRLFTRPDPRQKLSRLWQTLLDFLALEFREAYLLQIGFRTLHQCLPIDAFCADHVCQMAQFKKIQIGLHILHFPLGHRVAWHGCTRLHFARG